MGIKTIMERWIDDNVQGLCVTNDTPDPTESQLTELVKYLVDNDEDFIASAIENHDPSNFSKCLRDHAAYFLDMHTDYLLDRIESYSRQYAIEQSVDYFTSLREEVLINEIEGKKYEI